MATESIPAEDTEVGFAKGPELALAKDVETSFVENALATIRLKGLKYSMVSVFNVIFGATLLYAIVHFTNRPTYGNIAAVCISAVPSYYLSRRWVWGKRGKSELRREVIPFWVFVTIGLVISTASVYIATHFFPTPADAPFLSPRKFLPNVANLAAFGVLWVIRFFWMDKAFHLDTHHGHGPLDVLLDEDEPV